MDTTISEFSNIDKSFNEGLFISKVNNIFVKLLTAIMIDELEEINHFIGDDVYNYVKGVIEEHKKNNTRQIFDELNVKLSYIDKIEVFDEYYRITVNLKARYLDYIINMKNKRIISGDDYERARVDYVLVFEKQVDAINQGIVKKCGNCGSSLDINNNGICEFCNKTYAQEDYDWVLTSVKKIVNNF